MGEKSELMTAVAIKEHLEEVSIPELEATLVELQKTVEWVKQLMEERKKNAGI
jgi:hypothetical protein